MSPEEIIAEMRDIHMPGSLEAALPARFAPEPFYVLAAILAILAVIWWRRRTIWRREAAAELKAALAEPQIASRWTRLVRLLSQVARYRRARPPECLFLPPERIGPAEVETLSAHIRKLVGRPV